MKLQEKDRSLARGLGFKEQDLIENREGRITHSERMRLGRLRRPMNTYAIVVGTATPLIFIIALFIAGIILQVTGWQVPPVIAVIACLSVMALPVYTLWPDMRRQRQLRTDMRGSAIDTLRTEVQLSQETDRFGNLVYFLQAGEQRFKLSQPAYHAFQSGERYILYISPRSRVLLAAEPLIQS